MTPREILQTVVREHESARRVAFCAVVATRGSVPQPPGTIMCVDSAANFVGTLGGGCVEALVRQKAHQVLSSGESTIVSFDLDDDFGFDDGMICGGTMDIAICPIGADSPIQPFRDALSQLDTESATLVLTVKQDNKLANYRIRIEQTPRLLIAGAGHIGKVLAALANQAGFEVHVIDDRSDYLSTNRFPPPIQTHAGPIAQTLQTLPIDHSTYIVIVTRGHKNDEAALAAVAHAPAAYVGMIGSKRKINVIFDDLRQSGFSDETLRRVHAPIGLAINAVTTEEIAVSILAQLIQIRRQSGMPAVEGPFPPVRPQS